MLLIEGHAHTRSHFHSRPLDPFSILSFSHPHHIHLHGDCRLATAGGEPVAAATPTPSVPPQPTHSKERWCHWVVRMGRVLWAGRMMSVVRVKHSSSPLSLPSISHGSSSVTDSLCCSSSLEVFLCCLCSSLSLSLSLSPSTSHSD